MTQQPWCIQTWNGVWHELADQEDIPSHVSKPIEALCGTIQPPGAVYVPGVDKGRVGKAWPDKREPQCPACRRVQEAQTPEAS